MNDRADRPDDPSRPLSTGALILVTTGLALGLFMNVRDVAIANISIPTIAGDLGVSPSQGTWVITSFAVANAIAVPTSGWFAKRVGEVRLFTICTLLFAAVSFACGVAPNFMFLVTMRTLQGLVAGPIIPLSQSLLLTNYPDRESTRLNSSHVSISYAVFCL